MSKAPSLTRRKLLIATASVAGASLSGPASGNPPPDSAASGSLGGPSHGTTGSGLLPTPSCPAQQTASQMEGPYYTPKSPKRSNLLNKPEPGATPLNLLFKVINRRCEQVPNVAIDLWCCDAGGNYDNKGMHLRGHQITDPAGLCRFELIKPGSYGNAWFSRTPHLHVKLLQPNGKVLTTQLYFPGHPLNESDGLFDPSLLLSLDGHAGQFVFVV